MTSDNPERGLILTYAPAARRGGLAALLALDDALALLLRTTREPAVGQLRLAWWREALARLDAGPPPAEPVLRALAAEVLPRGVRGEELVPIVHGWEVLIEEERLSTEALERYAHGRGALFILAGRVLGAGGGDPLREAGQGWALADLARNLDEPADADPAALALPLLETAGGVRWSRNGRALGGMALLARRDLGLPPGAPAPLGAPERVARLAWHRLTGR